MPLFFWGCYHYYKDRYLPEPVGHLLFAFALGVGSFYLGMLMYRGLGLVNLRFDAYLLAETNLPGLFAYAVLVIGLVEELAKLIPFLLIIIHFKEFDEPIDGIIYASFIALGFSAVENIQYLQYLTSLEALARGFAGPVVHIVFASIWGYYVGRAYLCRRALGRTLIAALAGAAFLHGSYDFVVIAMPAPALPLAASLIVGIWVWRLLLIRDLHALPAGPCPEDDEVSGD
ncbi:MAG: PrsW family intramembrane metalloprotease [Gammaproteobacteria bacterium]|nr:PrsW family intramembrane metalloprotease [Gammaproteobacteria bacterium]